MNLQYYLQVGKGLRKFFYYIGCAAGYTVPRWVFRHRLRHVLSNLSESELAEARTRADYYNRMAPAAPPPQGWTRVADYRYPWRAEAAFLDLLFRT